MGIFAPALTDGYIACLSSDVHRLYLLSRQTGKIRELARGTALFLPSWSPDSKSLYYQDLFGGADNPIYRVAIPNGGSVKLDVVKQPLPLSVIGYALAGVAPDGSPLVVMQRANSDLYALDLDLP